MYRERHRCVLLLRWRRRKRHVRCRRRGPAKTPEFYIAEDEKCVASLVGELGERRPVDMSNYAPPEDVVILLPKVFDFEEDYENAAKVIAVFRRALVCRRRIAYIDFSKMQSISPACIAVFCCYADLWKRRFPNVHPRTWTWQDGIEEKFREIGFFRNLGFKDDAPNPSRSRGPIRYMGLRSYEVEDFRLEYMGREIQTKRKEIESFVGVSLDKAVLYRSVSEAITNIYHHAYACGQCHLKKKWWMSVSYDTDMRILDIIVFDHGLGIPQTMLSSAKFAGFRRYFLQRDSPWGQAQRLQLAFEHTMGHDLGAAPKCDGRWHGCEDILKLISERALANKNLDGGSLFVVSLMAQYRYVHMGTGKRGVASEHATPLQGTLIEWKIRI